MADDITFERVAQIMGALCLGTALVRRRRVVVHRSRRRAEVQT